MLKKILIVVAALACTNICYADDLADIRNEIAKRHNEAVKRLQDWIALPSIAAENRNYPQGAEYMAQLAKDAGFQNAMVINTDGKPGVFATLDAGAKKTVGLYFMYDVKQFDPAEWSSPPLEARIVDKPGLGKAVVGRGAVNQKGPQSGLLAALHAIRAAGRKLPVNLVLVAEGEEEIGSPNFPEIVLSPTVKPALARTIGVVMPEAAQDVDGSVVITLGSKGDIECELIASGEKWGRGSTHDLHSSYAARVDHSAGRLVQALNTLVTPQGEPAIDGFMENVRPLSTAERSMLD